MNILIVEDTEFVAEAIAGLLRPVAQRVVIVATMREAVARLKANGFTVILLDLSLPDSRRSETFQRVAELKNLHLNRKVILMSGAPLNEEERSVVERSGADGFLEKYSPDFQRFVCALAN